MKKKALFSVKLKCRCFTSDLKSREESRQFKISEDRKAAQALADKINGLEISMTMGHGQDGRLYGSVTAKDIAEQLKKMINQDVDKRKIQLKENIKAYGKYSVELKILADISAKFVVYVHD